MAGRSVRSLHPSAVPTSFPDAEGSSPAAVGGLVGVSRSAVLPDEGLSADVDGIRSWRKKTTTWNPPSAGRRTDLRDPRAKIHVAAPGRADPPWLCPTTAQGHFLQNNPALAILAGEKLTRVESRPSSRPPRCAASSGQDPQRRREGWCWLRSASKCEGRPLTKAKVKCADGGGQTAEPDHSPSTDERDLPAQPS